MRYKINLCEDGSVVTADGEYLGIWQTDELDAFYEFIPDGESPLLFSGVFMGEFCKEIENWHNSLAS